MRVTSTGTPRAAFTWTALAGAALTVPLLWGAAPADGQGYGRRDRPPPPSADAGVFPYDGRLTFARIRYELRSAWGGWAGGQPGWAHDYPVAERNFMTVLSEISTARTFREGSRIVDLDDPELFRYPIAYMSEPGHWAMNDREAAAFRAYLMKGGFVIFDDFSGRDWINFEAMMRRVLPEAEIIRLTVDHPIFQAFFHVESLEFRHPNYRGYNAEFYGIFEDNDPTGRMMAIVNYNNDIGDYFEHSQRGFAPLVTHEAFKLGVNYWVYALTR